MPAKHSKGTKISVSTLPLADPAVYVKINCTIGIDIEDGEIEEIESTCLDSETKEYVNGLTDSDMLSLSFNVDHSDDGYKILKSAKDSGAELAFEIEFKKKSDEDKGRAFNFNGKVRSLPWSAQQGSLITGSGSVRVVGDMTETDPVPTV